MHTLKKLAREIHRRSVWQVLGAYALICWVTLVAVDLASAPLGLPLWTGDMALVLLLVGLPVVTATTVTQGGLPWLRIEDVEDPNLLPGRTPEEVHVVPGRHPMHGETLFTWRNAILGGAMAAALLVTSVVAYLTMWGLGIGPVGSLMAQGLLEAGDRVILVDRTDPSSGLEAAAEALEQHLARSTVLDVTASGVAADAAGLDPVLDEARREGVDLVIITELAEGTAGYSVSARVVSVQRGQLASYAETAGSVDEAVLAAELVSTRVREKIGESLRAIRAQ
ncbi:MAG: hypothetical protein AAF389_00615 [Gemmatimonadota bacterium]